MKPTTMVLALLGLALQASAADPNSAWFRCDFEQPDWEKGWNLGNPNLPRHLELVRLLPPGPRLPPGAAFAPPLSGNGRATAGQALSIVLKQGSHYGADFGFDFAGQTGAEPEEACLSYRICLAPDFNAEAVQGGKLPGFGGIYDGSAGAAGRRVNGNDSWSARGAYWKPDEKGNIPIGVYVYHADMASDFGDTWYFSRALERGKWHEVRLYLKLNTPAAKAGARGRNNGILRAWLDGREVFERRDLRFRDVESLKIRNAWFHFYHGGTQPAAADHRIWIDDVVISPAP